MTWRASVASLLLAASTALGGCAVTSEIAERREAAAVAAHPPEGEFVEVAGTRVHYVRRGSGPELVLIHGAGGSLRDFTFALLDRAARDYTVTAFDRPGLGYTGRIPGVPTGPAATEAETIGQQAELLRRAARALGIERPVVLGHSYGGAVALAWAVGDLDAPSDAAASALVVLGGVAQPWPGGLDPFYTVNASPLGGALVVPLLAAYAPEARIEAAIASAFAPQAAPAGYAEHLGGRLTLRRDTFRANVRQVASLRPQVVAMAPRYPELALPIEVVHGTSDEVVPIEIHAEPLAGDAPGARLTPLPGVGHMPHHIRPEAVMEAIDRAAARAGAR